MTTTRLQLQRWPALTSEQQQSVLALHIPPEQIEFAGTMAQAVAVGEGASPDEVAGLAVLHAGVPVGFVVLCRCCRRGRPLALSPSGPCASTAANRAKATANTRWPSWRPGWGNTGQFARCSRSAWTIRTWPLGVLTKWRGSPSTRSPRLGALAWCATCRSL